MNHQERILACINGNPVDRPPLVLWRHFPVADQDPGEHAKATLDFQNRFDFDLIKVSPSSSYCLVDWNVKDEWRGNPEGTRDYIHYPITVPEDWKNLQQLDPNRGFLSKTIDAIKLIQKQKEKNTPIIQTIFSPLSQAKNLIGKDNLALHLRKFPEALITGLETITASIFDYLSVLQSLDVDGIYYAVQHAQYSQLSDSEFEQFCRQFDLRILNACRDFSIRVLHIHGNNIMLNSVKDYPVNLINWHDRESEFSLQDGKLLTNSAVCGGISQKAITLGNPDQVIAEVINTWEESDKNRTCIGTGCVIPVITPEVNIYAARKAVESLVL
jgi:uroporphyrinogen decarboxylase